MTRTRLAAAACLALACATSRRAAPIATPPGTAEPSPAPARAAYGDEGNSRRSPFEERLLLELQRAMAAAGTTLLTSAALDRAAAALVSTASRGEPDPLARHRVEAAMRSAAAFDPAPRALLASGQPDQVISALLAALAARGATHLGLAHREDRGVQHVVLLLSRRRARLDRFPSTVEPGADAQLSGVLIGLHHPRVFVTRPDGTSEELDVAGGKSFSSRIRFALAGAHAVEVTGTGGSGPEVAALLWVMAGPGAAFPEPPRQERTADPEDLDEAEAAVFAAVNRLRQEHDLPPLARSAELGAVARRHSVRMLAAETVAHVLPDSPEIAERLLAARIPFRHVFENVARGESGLAAHAATEASPAHRGYLLDARATRLGVGLARGKLRTGEPIVYLTEILVEPSAAAEPDRLTADARVREALWRERERRALPPLTNDLALEALAREAAAAMLAGDGGEAGDLAGAALRLGRGLAAADAFVASGPEEALRSRNLPDRRFKRVGVGVVTGDSRRFGPGRLFIAVVYSD